MSALRNLAFGLAGVVLVTSSVAAQQADGPRCGTHVPSLQIVLDHGAQDQVAAVMAGLLDDPSAHAFITSLPMDAAHEWFSVLFHPTLVNALVEDTDARKARWSAMADAIEDAYVPAKDTTG